MSNCPLCDGQVIVRVSSVGEDAWCIGCKAVLSSVTLDFKFATGVGVTECQTADGFPGYKGPGDKAVCHGYTQGNDDQKKKAMQKAQQSAYMKQKKSHVASLTRQAGQFGGGSTAMSLDTSNTNINSVAPATNMAAQSNPDLEAHHPPTPSTVSNQGIGQFGPGGGGAGGAGIGVDANGIQGLSDQNKSTSMLNQNM